ncbi:MAG: acetyl-CoA carboxylase biotin carboxyl carrier protein subunit [Proteobacteria bacterium]|nr:acetyl-CoA carboxylase biotin carboxyl carrier protein subunit [Pseudomonadota bacterium]
MAHEILATLPGKVSQLNINVGDRVEADEEALLIELMKMETPILIPCNGIIKEVRVKAGDEVEENDILAVIETVAA